MLFRIKLGFAMFDVEVVDFFTKNKIGDLHCCVFIFIDNPSLRLTGFEVIHSYTKGTALITVGTVGAKEVEAKLSEA